ncbi:MAG TPA: nitroreductase family protein [Noviherbaspirillum sp.]
MDNAASPLTARLARRLLAGLPPAWQHRAVDAFRRGRDHVRLMRAYAYDWRTYRRGSGLFRKQDRGVIEAQIIKAYHRIEKGLALPAPRSGFGKDAVAGVLDGVATHERYFGASTTTARALNTLHEYLEFTRAGGADVSWLEPRLAALAPAQPDAAGEGGTREVTREEILAAARRDLSGFFSTRFSVRQFSGEPVSDDLLVQAVSMAKKSPSVCNRESGGVYVASDPAKKAALLALQNGNRGFGEYADRVLVITSRMDTFLSVGERYQCWIDGGLFAMSLIYALHSLGVGTCCLNWSVEPATDRALKKLSGIPADHAVVMLLAVGHLPPTLRVAQSPRRALSEVLHFI